MDYARQIDMEAAKRLSNLLALPPPANRDDCGVEGFFDPWDAFDGIVGSYDGMLDIMAIKTLEAIRDRTTFELQDGEHGLFVQFFLHILAGHNYVDYGISPRGAFPVYGATDTLLDMWIEKWKEWYPIYWEEPLE